MRGLRTGIAVLILVVVGCTPDEPGQSDHEKTQAALERTMPGMKGGICGVAYGDCSGPDHEPTFDRFRGLSRTGDATSCQTGFWVASPANGALHDDGREIRVGFSVPRLINDHGQSSDRIDLIALTFDGDRQGEMSIYRNGVRVAGSNGELRSDNTMRTFGEFSDIYLGSGETVLALGADVNYLKTRLTQAIQKCPAAPTGECRTCWIGKGLVAGGVAATVAYLGRAAGAGASAAVVSGLAFGGAFVQTQLDRFLSCAAECARAKCNAAFNDCRETVCHNARSCKVCEADLAKCCGAKETEGGCCLGIGDSCDACAPPQFCPRQ